jgi:peptidoglycan/LPS O-acetylase OafA/YrhL
MNKRIDWVRGAAILLIVGFHTIRDSGLAEFFNQTYGQLETIAYIPPLAKLVPTIGSARGLLVTVISIVCGLGYQGVHLFLVTSGMVLTLSFMRKGMDVRKWYLRRAERILPMYWTSLVVVYVLLQWFDLYARFIGPKTSLLAMLLQAAGLHVLAPNFFYGLNPPVWFIGLLLQLYLVFPLLIGRAERHGPTRVFLFALLVTIVSRLIGQLFLLQLRPQFTLGGFFGFRLAEFVFGMAIAYHIGGRRLTWINWLQWLALPLYLCGITLHCFRATVTLSDPVMGISLFLLLWTAARCAPSLVAGPLVFLGRHSLGIFLFHYPLLKPLYIGFRSLGIHNGYVVFACVIVAVLAIGVLIDIAFGKAQQAVTEYVAAYLRKQKG